MFSPTVPPNVHSRLMAGLVAVLAAVGIAVGSGANFDAHDRHSAAPASGTHSR